jgi:hypothetical protein
MANATSNNNTQSSMPATGVFTPWKSSQNKNQRMAGELLSDFAKGNVANVLGGKDSDKKKYNRDFRYGEDNKDKTNVTVNTIETNSFTSPNSPVQPTDNEYTPNYQGGVAGDDYPDPNNGSVVVNNNGTMSQTTADGQRIEWGTEEALQSAIEAKQDAQASVQNYREIDYDTNLPSDFDPGGKDQLAHARYLCSLGVQHFCEKANGLVNQYS